MSKCKSMAKSRVKTKVQILLLDSLTIKLHILEVEWLSVSNLWNLDFPTLDDFAEWQNEHSEIHCLCTTWIVKTWNKTFVCGNCQLRRYHNASQSFAKSFKICNWCQLKLKAKTNFLLWLPKTLPYCWTLVSRRIGVLNHTSLLLPQQVSASWIQLIINQCN